MITSFLSVHHCHCHHLQRGGLISKHSILVRPLLVSQTAIDLEVFLFDLYFISNLGIGSANRCARPSLRRATVKHNSQEHVHTVFRSSSCFDEADSARRWAVDERGLQDFVSCCTHFNLMFVRLLDVPFVQAPVAMLASTILRFSWLSLSTGARPAQRIKRVNLNYKWTR
jgi:hypothetical protein